MTGHADVVVVGGGHLAPLDSDRSSQFRGGRDVMVFSDPPFTIIFHQNQKKFESQDSVRSDRKTWGHLGKTSHFATHISGSNVGSNEPKLGDGAFYRGAFKNRLNYFDMALLECLSTIANGPKDVGEATVLRKVTGYHARSFR